HPKFDTRREIPVMVPANLDRCNWSIHTAASSAISAGTRHAPDSDVLIRGGHGPGSFLGHGNDCPRGFSVWSEQHWNRGRSRLFRDGLQAFARKNAWAVFRRGL